MKSFLKKLHISSQSEDSEGSTSSAKIKGLSDVSSSERQSNIRSDSNKPFSAISGWLNSVTNRQSPSPPSSSNVSRGNTRMEPSDSASSSGLEAALDAVRCDSESTNWRDADLEEEYQIQLALELSAREDPEAVQIEAVKQISLGSCVPENTPAEIVAYRYWNYNALSFDDKILDGFYDLHGILIESDPSKMPSLIDLQRTPVTDEITWEAILVNRAADSKLLKVEQKALEMAVKVRSESIGFAGKYLVQKLAMLVSEHMGGPVGDPDSMLMAWRSLSHNLKVTFGSMVLPLGSLTVGLARHRALLFKILADSVGLPCRLIKGQEYTGSDEVAMNYVKLEDGREYIVDLMADPGTLIPSDTPGIQGDYEESILSLSPSSKDVDSHMGSSSSGVACSSEDHSEYGMEERKSRFGGSTAGNESPSSANSEKQKGNNNSDDFTKLRTVKEQGQETSSRTGHSRSPYSHTRSPSWTEGVSPPAVRRMKAKDVSLYMIDAAKENPQLAQKLRDVLLESGVVAPPNLFTEVYSEQLDASSEEGKSRPEDMESQGRDEVEKIKSQVDLDCNNFLPPLPSHAMSKVNPRGPFDPHLDGGEVSGQHVSPHSELAAAKFTKNMPVAAAAAAAAAVVASSMVVAAAKTTYGSKADLPVAAAATATAAAVVATTVAKQYENLETSTLLPNSPAFFLNLIDSGRVDRDADGAVPEQQGGGDQVHEALGVNSEGERVSDRSAGNDSVKSDVTLDDVADCEIPWEEITLGERIGLGSYGEVYRGEWHGTEVAVKKFLDQEFTGESLEEFKSEIYFMHLSICVLPPNHGALLTHHLKRLKNSGYLAMNKHSYMLAAPGSAPPPPPSAAAESNGTDVSTLAIRKPGRPPKLKPEVQPQAQFQAQFQDPFHAQQQQAQFQQQFQAQPQFNQQQPPYVPQPQFQQFHPLLQNQFHFQSQQQPQGFVAPHEAQNYSNLGAESLFVSLGLADGPVGVQNPAGSVPPTGTPQPVVEGSASKRRPGRPRKDASTVVKSGEPKLPEQSGTKRRPGRPPRAGTVNASAGSAGASSKPKGRPKKGSAPGRRGRPRKNVVANVGANAANIPAGDPSIPAGGDPSGPAQTPKRRGRPPKASSQGGPTASAVGVTDVPIAAAFDSEGFPNPTGGVTNGATPLRKRRGRPPKSYSSPAVAATVKRPRKLSGRPLGRPKKCSLNLFPLGKRRGRPPKSYSSPAVATTVKRPRKLSGRPLGRPKKNMTSPAVSDPKLVVAYEDLKGKLEHMQSRIREATNALRPCLNAETPATALAAFQELEELATPGGVDPMQQN